MPSKFCYKCGALEEDKGPLIEGLCRDCFREENPLIRAPDKLKLEICRGCGAYFLGNKAYDVEKDPATEYLEAAKEEVSSQIEVLQKGPTGSQYSRLDEAKDVDVGFEAKYTSPEKILVEVGVQIKSFGSESPLTGGAKVVVELVETTCEICRKKKTGYYEAILQVRGEQEIPENKLKEIYRDLQEEFMKMYERDREEFVSRVKRKHGGINLYLSSSKLVEDLARFLSKEYGAQTNQSAELIGQTDDGKEKYRVTIVARLPL